MPDQSLKRPDSEQRIGGSPRPTRNDSVSRRRAQGNASRTKAVLWVVLFVAACLMVFALIMIIPQIGRNKRVYDHTIVLKNSNQRSRPRKPAENPKPSREKPGRKGSGSTRPDIDRPDRYSRSEKPGSLENLIKQIKPSVVFIEARGKGQGSGFLVSKNGHVLTCYHVVEGASRIEVIYTDAMGVYRKRSASILWFQKGRDVALIRMKQIGGLVPMKLGNAEYIGQGHKIIAVGYPLGSSLGIEPTVTTGIISSIRQSGSNEMLLQINAAVNPGNSGGALISVEKAQVIGIVGAKIQDAEGIGFAIPITTEFKSFLNNRFLN